MSKSCGEALMHLLESYGVTTVFGIPGEHTLELYRGIEKSNVRAVTPRNEQGASFMADGWARVTGEPGVCTLITGPGVTNAATGIGQAYADSIPMLVISSANDSVSLGKGWGRLHETTDLCAITRPLTAFSAMVHDPAEVPELIAQAFTVFRSRRPRPVHIAIPIDVMEMRVSDDWQPYEIADLPIPAPAAIETAARLLAQARSCVMIVGGGAQQASAEVTRLAERLQVGVIASNAGKGVVADSNPLSLGGAIISPVVHAYLARAEVVLAIGTELGETDTLLFDDKLEISGQVIRVDIEPEQMTRNVLPSISICADAGLTMKALHKALAGITSFEHQAEVAALREAADILAPDAYRKHGQILDLVAATLPGVVVAGDSTQPVYGANLFYEADQPRRYFNSSTGYGTLGFGLPAALGAKLGLPDTPVVSLIGDGGLQFTIAELATAVELELAVPILVWNNQGYGEIKRYMLERDIPTIGVDIYTPDFITIAKGFGCEAITVNTRDEFIDALRRADKASKPTLIDIPEHLALNW